MESSIFSISFFIPAHVNTHHTISGSDPYSCFVEAKKLQDHQVFASLSSVDLITSHNHADFD